MAVPEVCVREFDGDITDHLVKSSYVSPWRNWACFHTPMFALEVNGKPYRIVPRTIGGSYSVLVAEQLLASGARVIVGLTSAGRVSAKLQIPSLVVATAAIRDEGTSFHYLAPSRSVAAPREPVALLAAELKGMGLPVYEGVVWTTDAPYRETRQQLNQYSEEGVLAAEMQAASLFALAQMRHAQIAIILTWLHQARRQTLKVHPRSDLKRRLTGVLAARSPDRPNPIGLHEVTVRKK